MQIPYVPASRRRSASWIRASPTLSRSRKPSERVMKALDYHEATKHSWARIHADPHALEFANMPLPFKIYSDVARAPLPTEWAESSVPALAALAQAGAGAGGDRAPGVNDLAHLLSAIAITRRRRHPFNDREVVQAWAGEAGG